MKNNQLALFALAVAAFAIGSTEFISVGLLPLISRDFNVTIPTAGLTVSMYALGVTIGAPILTTLTARINRKRLLLIVMIVFTAGNLFATFSPLFNLLLAARIITAFSHGVFMSIATTIASDLVPANKRSSAIAMMFTGLTVATITGVPIGTFIGQQLGWAWSFALIAVVGLISLVAIYILIPSQLSEPPRTSIISQLKVLKNSQLLMMYIITALGYGGTFVIYTYITPLLKNELQYSNNAVVMILVGYGVMVAIGNTVGGRLTNHKPTSALIVIFIIQALALFIVGVTAAMHTLGLIAVLAMGLFAFMNVPGLQLIVVLFAEKYTPDAVSFASSLNISAFNVGIMIGSMTGGYIVEVSQLTIAPYVGAVMVLAASLLMYVVHMRETRGVEINGTSDHIS